MAGTIFGEVGGSHLLLRAMHWTFHVRQGSIIRIILRGRQADTIIFGDVAVSLFVAGAVFGEIWVDSLSAKCCIFPYRVCL